MANAFQFSVDDRGIGKLVFDYPNEKINKISVQVLEELEGIIDRLQKDSKVKALVIKSAKKDIYIAGADLQAFEPLFNDREAAANLIDMGHRVFDKLSRLPFPTIAAIDGACLGGGLELSLACTYRVVTDHPKTSIGLPEVSLGIFPGWGGTQRLPRLVGLVQGLTMIVTGKPVNGKKAWKIKLADAIFPREFLNEKADEFAELCLLPKEKAKILERRKQRGWFSLLFEKNFIGRAILYWKTRKEILKKTKGKYHAPIVALDLVRETFSLPLERGLSIEAENFVDRLQQGASQAKYLIGLFFDSETIKKNPGFDVKTDGAKKIEQVGVLGAGTMGSGITWLCSKRDIPVRMKDVSWDFVGKGYASIWNDYKTLIRIRKLKSYEADLKFHKISSSIDYSGFQNLDLVVEAATENFELKKKIFHELEEVLSPQAIIATNTSSLTVDSLASEMKHPERFVGMHFFNPVPRMPLVEVVAGKKTSPEVVAAAVELCKRLKKTPIVVGDCPGFVVNRIFAIAETELLTMLEEGVDFMRLENLFVDFGMPMGPFLLGDEVGNDVSYKVLKNFEEAYGARMKAPSILAKVYENKLFGKKCGKGFYLHGKGKPTPNPEIGKLLGKKGVILTIDDDEVMDRVMFSMINEACRCLEEKIVAAPLYLDMALIMGMGFPPFRGGLLRYADTIGSNKVLARLQEFSEKHGSRYAPCAYLVELAKENKKFHP